MKTRLFIKMVETISWFVSHYDRENAHSVCWSMESTRFWSTEESQLVRRVLLMETPDKASPACEQPARFRRLSEECDSKTFIEEPMKAFTENTNLVPRGLLNEYAKYVSRDIRSCRWRTEFRNNRIGAPIYDESGNVWVAAVSIGAPKMRVDAVKMEGTLYLLIREIAKEMSE